MFAADTHAEAKPATILSASGPKRKFYRCSCGIVQLWEKGNCLDSRCGKSLLGCPVVDEADVPRSQDVERSERPTRAPVPPSLALETNLSALCLKLAERGVVQIKSAKPLTLPMVTRWTPEQRREAAMFCERLAPKPAFLENGVYDEPADDGPGGEDEVVVDEDGDARTRAEMREKHADIACTDTDIDASAPEIKKLIEPESPKPRRRDVHGSAAKMQSQTIVAPSDVAVSPTTVTVTWGEEKFTPIPGSYSTCSVGPFSVTLPSKPGQEISALFAEANAMLAEMVHAHREEKIAAFVSALRRVTAAVKQ